jgi:mxaJ protein
MSSRCRDALALAAGLVVLTASFAASAGRTLRFCADPDDLPYSSKDERGFENRIAALVARDLGAKLRYYWLPQWRGYARKTLLQGHCDVIPGIPADVDNVLTTAPYYRGTYAFVYSARRFPGLVSLDDARLRRVRIGLQVVGVDAIATPPGHALARRGIVDNVVGFPVMGEVPSAARIVDALADGELDVGIVWSPQPGYFIAKRQAALDVVPIRTDARDPGFVFAIAMGVRRGDVALQRAIDASIEHLRPQIDAVLRDFAVTRVDADDARRVSR